MFGVERQTETERQIESEPGLEKGYLQGKNLD